MLDAFNLDVPDETMGALRNCINNEAFSESPKSNAEGGSNAAKVTDDEVVEQSDDEE